MGFVPTYGNASRPCGFNAGSIAVPESLGRPLLLTLVAIAIVASVLAWRPDFDLAAAHEFYNRGTFIGRGAIGNAARFLGWVIPFGTLLLATLGWIGRRAGLPWPWLPRGRTIAFFVLSMAIGPGLLVNVALKDHWHRPRPVQITDFGGHLEFRPWYRTDGACNRNCSFVSGEASSATWMLAPALVAPPALRAGAVVGALAFGAAVGGLRMAFGGHFLSDTLLSILLTCLVILILSALLLNRGRKRTPS
jgi:lipid A 4'-phosphatase